MRCNQFSAESHRHCEKQKGNVKWNYRAPGKWALPRTRSDRPLLAIIHGPSAQWLRIMDLGDGCYKDACVNVLQGRLDKLPAEEKFDDVNPDGVTGDKTTKSFMVEERKRANKSTRWVRNPDTRDRLAAATQTLRRSCTYLGHNFGTRSRKHEVDGCLLNYVHENANPAVKLHKIACPAGR